MKTIGSAAALVIVIMSVAAGSSIERDFFDPPLDRLSDFDPNGIYPSGQIFPISFYSILPADMAAAKDSYVPLVGSYYRGTSSANLAAQDLATALGLRFIHQIEPGGVTFQDSSPTRLTVLDAAKKDELRAQIRQQMASTLTAQGRNALLYAWGLYPEELRPWRPIEMQYLEYIADTIRAIDRENGNVPRPILLYNPGNRLKDTLTTLGRHLDILLKGAYVNSWPTSSTPSSPPAEPRAWVRWAMDNVVGASNTLSHHPVPFIALEMSEDPPRAVDRNPETIRRWVRHGVYLSLVRGTKGILVWSGWRPRTTLQQTFDYWFDGYRSTAVDLNGSLQLGRVFLFGERRQDIAVTVRGGPDTVSYRGSDGVAQTDPSVTFADIAFGSGRYLVAINSAAEPVVVEFSGLPPETVDSLRLFDAQTATVEGRFEYTFQPYEVAAWRFTASAMPARAQIGAPVFPFGNTLTASGGQ